MLSRLQAKMELSKMVHLAGYQVSKAAATLTAFKGSKVQEMFCKILTTQLVGVWCRKIDGIYYFMDPNYHSKGPTLLHFKTSSLDDMVNRQEK